MTDDSKQWIADLIAPAGVIIDGTNPWDIKVNNPKLYDRVRSQGVLGLGESYMDEWWDCANLDQFFYRLLRAKVDERVGLSLPLVWGGYQREPV
jgi:cyclopropane-fatty-acyl-phospholipid synthase